MSRPIEFHEVNASLRGLIRQCCHFANLKNIPRRDWEKKTEGNVCFAKVAQLLRALGKRLRPYSSGCSDFSEIPYLSTATTWKLSRDFKMSTLQRNKVDLLLHPKEDSNESFTIASDPTWLAFVKSAPFDIASCVHFSFSSYFHIVIISANK